MSEQYYKNPLRHRDLRKELCICGSKRKIRKCCGKENAIPILEYNRITRMIDKLTKGTR